MGKTGVFSWLKLWFVCCTAVYVLSFSGVGHAYSFQNSEYSFRIECPQEPRKTIPVTDAADKGVALDFSLNDEEVFIWMVQVRKSDFVDTRKLSAAEIQVLLTELRNSDYGEQICDKTELIDAGKYQGVLLQLHDMESLLAISMFRTEKGTYLVTLVGSATDRPAFERNLRAYRRGLATFALL